MREHSADESDIASEQEMWATDLAIKIARTQKPAAEATGYCLNCEETVEGGRRWCTPACRDDWQRFNRA